MPTPPPKNPEHKTYCLDTSVLINGWRKHYCQRVFPSVWSKLDELIRQGAIHSCEEVLRELQEQEDDLYSWAEQRKAVFVKPNAAVLANVKKLMTKFPNIAASGGSRNKADPWLVSQAMLLGAIVVTDEQPPDKGKPTRDTKPPKIPTVCEHFGVWWLRPVEFFADIGASF